MTSKKAENDTNQSEIKINIAKKQPLTAILS
jgi:hypothetical protein